MTKAFDSIKRGLEEAIALNQGKKIHVRTHRREPIDVAKLRHTLGLTQVEFATKFSISVATLRHWERGDRAPHGPALVLLHVVAKEPEAVLRALGLRAPSLRAPGLRAPD